ncbi:MAG: multidrug effflux MFS transporter [Paracoccaceae bacterium]
MRLSRTTAPHIVTLVLLSGMGALTMNIFLPSLPSMAVYFGTDYAVIQLVVTAYLGMTAVLQLVIGPLSDRYGRRPVMLWALVVFSIATVGCILAGTIEVFLAFRLLQAAVASGIVLSRAIVRDMVPADQAASMIGYVTMGMAVMPMIGPAIGGYLDEHFGWQSSFEVILVIGLLVLVLTWADLGETNTHRSQSFTQQFRAYPELALSRRFWGYALTAAFASGAFFAFLGGGPYVATQVLGMEPSEVGLHFGLIATGYMLGNFLSGRFSARAGINRMTLVGGICSSLGMSVSLVLFLSGYGSPLTLFGGIMFVGIGNGLTLPNATAGMVSVRPHLAGSASGLGGALMIGGGAALATFTGSILGPRTGAFPLLYMMLSSSMLSVVTTVYVISVARRKPPLITET